MPVRVAPWNPTLVRAVSTNWVPSMVAASKSALVTVDWPNRLLAMATLPSEELVMVTSTNPVSTTIASRNTVLVMVVRENETLNMVAPQNEVLVMIAPPSLTLIMAAPSKLAPCSLAPVRSTPMSMRSRRSIDPRFGPSVSLSVGSSLSWYSSKVVRRLVRMASAVSTSVPVGGQTASSKGIPASSSVRRLRAPSASRLASTSA